MKLKQKGLQKFTESEIKINKILELDQITDKDLVLLTKSESQQLSIEMTKRFNSLKGVERDNFYHQIELIADQPTKNQLWEANHVQITWAISTLMQEFGRMPTKNEIANKTELSRQTIHKHLKEFTTHPQYLGHIEQFRFMTSKVLAKVFNFAVNGDIAAAKLYLNAVGNLNQQTPNGTLIQNQNNYIQINGMVLSQESIKRLNSEQLEAIESVLKSALLPMKTT